MAISAPIKCTNDIRNTLIHEIRTGLYTHAKHLPPETELASALGISRTQLRDALAVLDQEGFITRRHGVGTLINRHVVDVPVRMDIEMEFLEMIRAGGYRPGLAFVRCREQPASEDVAHCLGLSADTPVLLVERLCTADGRPAIYCQDIFEKALVQKDYAPEDLNQSIFSFLQQFCGVSAYMDLTDLRPVCADGALAALLEIPEGSPVLSLREVDYDVNGKSIFYSLQYFADGFFSHTLLRKKL